MKTRKQELFLNLFNRIIYLAWAEELLRQVYFFPAITEVHVILYEIYRHKEVLFSSGLLLQENSKVQVHWKTYIKYLTMLPALGMQHWPKTGSKLSSIAFLSIIFWRIRKSVYLIIPASIWRVFLTSMEAWKLITTFYVFETRWKIIIL